MEKVLIVDDEKSIRITLQRFLAKEGYDTETAEEAETAIQKIKNTSFDIIITDILLPKISGIQLLSKILDESPYSKVIMITGEPNVTSAAESLRLGACDYLFKPVNKDSVIKSVKNAARLKKLEDENRKYQENLEELVKERTTELEKAMSEMQEMQKELLHQERLKGLDLITSGIAHDINNSLSPIMMYTETLAEKLKDCDDNFIDYIARIISSAEQIEKSVRNIEQFHTKANITYELQDEINPAELFEQTTDFFRIVKDKVPEDVKISVELEDNVPNFKGKKNMIFDILKELVTNALWAVGEKGTITLIGSYDGTNVNIIVEDDGVGMNDDQKEHCCDPYYTTKGPQANGLGLSRVYGVVCRHNGQMKVESRPDEGTIIRLSFPALLPG